MSKPGERIWPEEGKQPTWDLVIEDETFTLTWANTWMRFHRTGDPEFDEGLETFDHVLHNCGVDEKGYATFRVWPFEQLDPECRSFLLQNGFSYSENTIPEDYILDLVAAQEAGRIPDAIGPDFGRPSPTIPQSQETP